MTINNDMELQQAEQRLEALMQNQSLNAVEIVQIQEAIFKYSTGK